MALTPQASQNKTIGYQYAEMICDELKRHGALNVENRGAKLITFSWKSEIYIAYVILRGKATFSRVEVEDIVKLNDYREVGVRSFIIMGNTMSAHHVYELKDGWEKDFGAPYYPPKDAHWSYDKALTRNLDKRKMKEGLGHIFIEPAKPESTPLF